MFLFSDKHIDENSSEENYSLETQNVNVESDTTTMSQTNSTLQCEFPSKVQFQEEDHSVKGTILLNKKQ